MVRRVVYSRFSSFPTTRAAAYKSPSRSRRRRGGPVSPLSPEGGEGGGKGHPFTRAKTLCVRYVDYYAVARRDAYVSYRESTGQIFYEPGRPAIKISRRLKNRSACTIGENDAVLSRAQRFFTFTVHLT